MQRAAVGVAALLLGCTPGTTRPAFQPSPEALTLVLNARPERVIPEIAALIAAEGLRVEWASPRDGYLETAWYDTRARQSISDGDVPDLAATVKMRCWADPYVPGQTRLTVEPVYRPLYDPSRTERDLELVVPLGQDGHRIAERLLGALKDKFGTPRP